MKIAVIVVHYGSSKITKETLKSLKTKIHGHQLFLVNNTVENIDELTKIIPDTKLISNGQNLGFSGAVNLGISNALKSENIEAIMLVNNDLVFESGSLDQLVLTFRQKHGSGIVSPVLKHGQGMYDWGGSVSKITGLVKHLNFPNSPKTILNVKHVSGAAMLIKRDVVEKIGLFGQRFFMYFEDADYCLRARQAGFSIHINPLVTASHIGSAGSAGPIKIIHLWKSHFRFSNKHLFRGVFPTAYLADLFYYPLLLIKTVIGI